jgi:hypothetical protein
MTVIEGVKDGQRVWVNVRVKTSRKGDKFLSVSLKPQQGGKDR